MTVKTFKTTSIVIDAGGILELIEVGERNVEQIECQNNGAYAEVLYSGGHHVRYFNVVQAQVES